jgi:hypothetical protein
MQGGNYLPPCIPLATITFRLIPTPIDTLPTPPGG